MFQQGKQTVSGSTLLTLVKYAAVLIAASVLGNWFLAEFKKARSTGAPWYKPYFSAPGAVILLAILLPVFYWFFSR
jgi:hypothetical protein